jgi:LmbE family N-acetylglucosaminyl deacetylase
VIRCGSRGDRTGGSHASRNAAHSRELGDQRRRERESLQRMLEHAPAAVTLDVYSDLFDTDLDAISAALDDVIRRLPN